ncbi:MAG: hypothetical protein ACK4WD_04980, partial [Flavobacteriales bacterium]
MLTMLILAATLVGFAGNAKNLEVVPPNLNLDLQPNSLGNCGPFNASLQVIASQVGYSYQLLNAGTPT